MTGPVALPSVRTVCKLHCCYSDPLLSSPPPPTAVFQRRTCDHVDLSSLCLSVELVLRATVPALEGGGGEGVRGDRGDTAHPWMEPVSGSLTDGSGLV